MAEKGGIGGAAPGADPSTQELEEQWKQAVDALTEAPRNVDLLLRIGQLSERLGRAPEAYNYYRKSLTLDPSKSFLAAKLRALAVTPEQKEEAAKFSRQPASFKAALDGLYLYPVRGKGLALLLLGGLFIWLSRFLVKGGGLRVGGLLGGLAAAYLSMFFIDVCHTTINGEDHLPDWPDPLRVSEFLWDVLKFFVAKLVALGPAIAVLIIFGFGDVAEQAPKVIPDFQMKYAKRPAAAEAEGETPAQPAATPAPPPVAPETPSILPRLVLALGGAALLGLVGLIYLPMATLSNVVMGSPFTCLNVPFIVRSIVAAPRNYLICLGAYFGTLLVVGGAETMAFIVGILPTGFAVALLELYCMTVLMRLMGLFYRINQAKLAWMAD